tara:strand:- start:1849 stop:2397 length:549 start_codon:yes stop_codon:yes gene_type:complete
MYQKYEDINNKKEGSYKSIFSTPIWIKDINSKKLDLVSTNFKPHFLSNTLSSFSDNPKDNKLTESGMQYLKTILLDCLKDFNINNCNVVQIWRNIYNDDFQERHNHSNSHFSFTIYEKLLKPQTMFYHPAHDMIYATGINNIIYPYCFPKVKQDQIILFPSYLDHMVIRSKNSMTISGNIEI